MRPAILACCLALTIPLPDRSAAQACFDAARCARDALMSTRALSREMSLLSNNLRALRDEANLRDTELAQMRERLAELTDRMEKQAERIEALEAENAALRDSEPAPDASE
jgi:chromosome segregation ATPase